MSARLAAKYPHMPWTLTPGGVVDDTLTVDARYADLVVVGQSGPENAPTTPGNLPESIAMASGRPTLVVPHDGPAKAIGKTVMLCWNASRESARAASENVRSARCRRSSASSQRVTSAM